ncbi:NRDE family protein [Flavobacterium salilacus subsp. salilacus]|uniref:NRDE family protein n=1 Tax=Flavobacterium TaxID=237 RepID=UPI001074D2E1|nr:MULTISPECIES: NRDE family protein [Flavobacterium]KAF2517563.1 NRDE family protein [Flavobacterium salilacus subsp. salilacus]MBE1615712.1 NRDE family protein [Flavobacterium sp. SaA2.13]
MCTVSFINTGDKVIITSNRDETIARGIALPPQTYMVNNYKIIFPRDPKAGGTWFAVKENDTIGVLLNGADKKHTHNPPYAKSRGLILLDIISTDSPIEYWNTASLDNIEPFTIVSYSNNKLHQMRWDGNNKNLIELNPEQNHIWASATLYSAEVQKKRKELFSEFLNNTKNADKKSILQFHQFTEENDKENGLVINRHGILKTVSITQAIFHKNKIDVYYKDLISGSEKTKTVVTL